MKIYSKVGTNAEIIDLKAKSSAPNGYIEMKERRPGPDYTAKEDGTWAAPDYAAEAWEAIKALRAQKQAGGFRVNFNGQTLWFNSDGQSRIQQIALKSEGGELPSGIQWKTLANDFIEMTPELADAMVKACARSDQAIFAAAEAHRVAMLKLEDPAGYDYRTGWPECYEEWLKGNAEETEAA